MTYTLHKSHAVVHTATIDVKILRLDKRQLTQSVFRQLDEQLIFRSDGTLGGTPWGRVNYTWKDNPPGTVFHVIYQDGENLKRSPVPATIRPRLCDAAAWFSDGRSEPMQDALTAMSEEREFRPYISKAIESARAALTLPPEERRPRWSLPYEVDRSGCLETVVWPELVRCGLATRTTQGWMELVQNPDPGSGVAAVLAALEQLHADIRKAANEGKSFERSAVASLASRVREMHQLEQLFIAA